jgi:hypothetical protein
MGWAKRSARLLGRPSRRLQAHAGETPGDHPEPKASRVSAYTERGANLVSTLPEKVLKYIAAVSRHGPAAQPGRG